MGNLRQRIVHIFGTKIDDKLVPVDEKTTVSGIQGYVLKPDAANEVAECSFSLSMVDL